MAVTVRLATEQDAAPLAAIYAPYVTDSRVSFEESRLPCIRLNLKS